MARESGVPIYIIVPHESGDAEGGQSFRKLLREMAGLTGGLMFSRPKEAELAALVARIRDEVRGQYLLSFPAPEAQPGEWRRLRVGVPAREARVRTIAGYYAR
jgi:hypothetical protein